MIKSSKFIIFTISLLFTFTVFTGCSRNNTISKAEQIQSLKNNSADTFNLEQLQDAMRAKGYNFKMQDVESNIFPTTKKRMNIGEDSINIYLFSSNEEMENEAKCLSKDGGQYQKGDYGMSIDWAFSPLFYKRGTIIAQYGDTEEGKKIISDLNDIFGEPFAGGRR